MVQYPIDKAWATWGSSCNSPTLRYNNYSTGSM